MKKLVLLLLFALVQNFQSNGLNVYNVYKMKRISDSVYMLNVKNGEEFYITLTGNGAAGVFYELLNYKELPDAIEYIGNNGKATETENLQIKNWRFNPFIVGISNCDYYFKFKAKKPSYNKISLKFGGFMENSQKIVQLNIS